jgi:hypothetical protein
MQIIVQAMPDVERNLAAAIEREFQPDTEPPLVIVNVGREAVTIFVQEERDLSSSDWTDLGLDPNRPADAPMYGYRTALDREPTPYGVRALVERFLGRRV